MIKADAVASLRINDASGDGEVDAAVVVVIRPGRAKSIHGHGQTGAFGDIHEPFAAFVVEQEEPPSPTPAIARKKNVLKAIVTVIDELSGVATQAHRVSQTHLVGDVLEGTVATIAKKAERRALGADDDVFVTIVVEIAPGGATSKSQPEGAGSIRDIAKVECRGRRRRNFQTEFFGDRTVRLTGVKSKGAQHPTITDIVGRVAAGLKSVRNAFGVSLLTEVDGCDHVRNDSWALLDGGNKRF